MFKNAILYFLLFFLLSSISGYHLRNKNKSKYLPKFKVKMPEFTVWNVPDEPSINNCLIYRLGFRYVPCRTSSFIRAAIF